MRWPTPARAAPEARASTCAVQRADDAPAPSRSPPRPAGRRPAASGSPPSGRRRAGAARRIASAFAADPDLGRARPECGRGAVIPRHRRRKPRFPKWRRWPVAAAGGLVVVGAVIAVIILTTSSGSSGPAGGKPAPRLQAPSPALAATLAPRHVEVVNEQPSTVTIRWVDPNNGIYPFVVRLSNGSVQTAASTTQTVVTGLDPAKGYCFVVGAVYGVGGQIADAPPVCVRGGTM